MKRTIVGILAVMMITTLYADDNKVLRAELAPLQFLVGWCWAGQFPDGKRTDVHCFEAVYGGVHLRDRHAVTGGSTLYRGETIYSWNGQSSEIGFVYWNSFGGVSTGTVAPSGDVFVFPDESYLGPGGETVTVTATWENITPDGYDSLSVETDQDGTKRERRVRYEKRPFTTDPLDAN